MTTIIIPQKPANAGSIHDINSDMMDRAISVPHGSTHVIILAAYYGGRGYSTHQSVEAAARVMRRLRKVGTSCRAYTATGKHLDWDGFEFRRGEPNLDIA